jgi:hypothetical protein
VQLPALPGGRAWHRVVDTSRASPDDIVTAGDVPVDGSSYRVADNSVVVLETR